MISINYETPNGGGGAGRIVGGEGKQVFIFKPLAKGETTIKLILLPPGSQKKADAVGNKSFKVTIQ